MFRILLVLSLLMTYGYVRLNMLNNQKSFSDYDLVEIYALGIIMPIIAYPFLPEVAKEHIGLMTANGKNQTGNGSFFLNSKVVSSAVKQSCSTGSNIKLKWTLDKYQLNNYTEARVALALNDGTVTCTNNKPTITINVDYPKKARAVLLRYRNIPVLEVEEGLFNILEEKGWYKPYKYIYEL